MSIRFRRSKSLGKLMRVNLTKTGIGFSVGVPGLRLSVSPRGQVRRTVGLPGTGLYDTEVIGNLKKPAEGRATSECPACKGRIARSDRFCRRCGSAL